jgi:hypothetical protein
VQHRCAAAEQGLGDTLQFIRYAPLVKQRGGRVLVCCQPSLIRLLARCPGVTSSAGTPKTREAVLGYTQMFSSLGGVIVSGVFYLASRYGSSLPAIHGAHAAWRYTLLSGVAPALPLIVVALPIEAP